MGQSKEFSIDLQGHIIDFNKSGKSFEAILGSYRSQDQACKQL